METHGVVKVENFLKEVLLFGHCEDFGLFALEKLLVLLAAVDCFECLQIGGGLLDVIVDFFHDFFLYLIHLDLLGF